MTFHGKHKYISNLLGDVHLGALARVHDIVLPSANKYTAFCHVRPTWLHEVSQCCSHAQLLLVSTKTNGKLYNTIIYSVLRTKSRNFTFITSRSTPITFPKSSMVNVNFKSGASHVCFYIISRSI